MKQMTKDKEHLIFGAGLIGCYLGGVLTSLGMKTSLVCRHSVQKGLMNGVKLTDYCEHEQKVNQLNTINSDELDQGLVDTKVVNFLWLTVKCTGVEQGAKDMAPFVGPETVIFCCQNGLGSESIVKQAFPLNQVLRVMVPFNVVEIRPGHLHRGSEGVFSIERVDKSKAIVDELVNALDCDLLPAVAHDDMSSLLWAKLQLNLSNSICALADIPVKAMLEQRGYRKIIALMMRELLAVADALNIHLPRLTALSAHKIPFILTLPDFVFTRIANKMLAVDPTVKSSMWWDVSQGKSTEIEHLNGAILKYAKPLGIPCPVNEKVVQLISQLSADKRLTTKHIPPISAKQLFALVNEE